MTNFEQWLIPPPRWFIPFIVKKGMKREFKGVDILTPLDQWRMYDLESDWTRRLIARVENCNFKEKLWFVQVFLSNNLREELSINYEVKHIKLQQFSSWPRCYTFICFFAKNLFELWQIENRGKMWLRVRFGSLIIKIDHFLRVLDMVDE